MSTRRFLWPIGWWGMGLWSRGRSGGWVVGVHIKWCKNTHLAKVIQRKFAILHDFFIRKPACLKSLTPKHQSYFSTGAQTGFATTNSKTGVLKNDRVGTVTMSLSFLRHCLVPSERVANSHSTEPGASSAVHLETHSRKEKKKSNL